ncbi:alkaline phosphatase D family protein [Muriicola soli]|uniref:Alkaline phosphatase family protein n=1 Tax=Muriicola soli TaxID=2507538 RepID=A0A411EAV8_9FLAO|nr:alkaline phosphatase D family protein [Muriicola soli]QBA64580.1 alkaline phosphatase family protein [Muriicola soli]
MKNRIILFLLPLTFFNCKTAEVTENRIQLPTEADFTIAFGSCNRHNVKNSLWDDVLATEPDVWIWGGDIVYADTDDPEKIAGMYEVQKSIPEYAQLLSEVQVIGTWDDHDYGLNDGGVEFEAKDESQQVFLDFMDVPENDPRRERKGVYAGYNFKTAEGELKILVLDTRYFRSALTPSQQKGKRYEPGPYGEGTVLGEEQWAWLEKELNASEADFNVIVSSIQFLSNQHGFETWGNFPHEVDKLKTTVAQSGAKGVIILSGDRHISEFSSSTLEGMSYPLIDFTSSGLTHVYSSYSGEPNPYRLGEVVAKKSFGLLRFNFKTRQVGMEMISDQGKVLNKLVQEY